MSTIWTPAWMTTSLWHDASDANTITLESGVVAEFRDKSGNNRNFQQATAAARPIITPGGLNGLDIITIASGKYLTAPDWLGTSGHYIYGVGVFTTAICRGLDGYGSGWSWQMRAAYPYIVATTNGSTSAASYGGFAYPAGTGIRSFLSKPGLRVEGAADGVSTGSATVPSNLIYLRNSTTGWNIGRVTTATTYAPGDLAEFILIVSSTAFPDADTMRKIEGYLAHKWGYVANLPSDHPYKTAAPQVRSISGAVTVNGTPAQRQVVLYANDGLTVAGSALSDPDTGEWMINGLPDTEDQYVAAVLGESGEYSKIFRHVVAG